MSAPFQRTAARAPRRAASQGTSPSRRAPGDPKPLSGEALRRAEAAGEREYRYTHGFAPEEGHWQFRSDFFPDELELLQPIEWVEYISRKDFEGPQKFIFHHDHKIEKRPWLARGRNKEGRLVYVVLGGGYKVTAHGIEDDGLDPRDLPACLRTRRGCRQRMKFVLPRQLFGMGKLYGFKLRDGSKIDLSGEGLVLAYTRGRRPGSSLLYIVPER